MCNGANHTSGCECGFGPPYPGTITKVSAVDWIDRAAHSRDVFKRTLDELNLDEAEIRKFIRDYYTVETSTEPSKIQKFQQLIRGLEFKDEATKIVPVKVPLFKLHSPFVKGAKVTYRESLGERQRGWFVTVLGIGTGSTNTYQVIYDSQFESVDGECKQVYVPLNLEVKSVAVYRSRMLVGRGASLSVQGAADEQVLRKRGSDLLDDEECRDSLVGTTETTRYNRKRQPKPTTENFDNRLWGEHIVRSIELETIKVFNMPIKPLAELEHHYKLDLEFKLPGKHNYTLRYNDSGLHWVVS